jgi:predicted small metal-binding protein
MPYNPERSVMSMVINCECGEVIRAATEEELVKKVEQHVGQAHPELVGKMSRDDILAMAEEE